MEPWDKTAFEERENIASATECTGLVQRLSDEDPEAPENYARLYAIHAPEQNEVTKDDGRKKDGTDTHAAHRGGRG